MAPLPGALGTPAKTSSARRAAPRPVIPVLPLNYPQRPTSKQAPTPPPSSDPATIQPRSKPVEEQPKAPETQPQPQELAAESQTELGASSPESTVVVTPSAASIQSGSVAASNDMASDTPTATPAQAEQPVPSPTPAQSSGHSNSKPASDSPGAASAGPPAPATGPRPGPGSGPAFGFHPSMMSQPGFHQSHPSNGSLVFGGYQDSNNSSPAPHPGAAYPPPGIMPYRPAAVPVTAVDGYGRPLLVSPTLDGYPPTAMNHHGPPTPHSFQGSQSSMQAEENFNQYAPVNGHNGYPATTSGQAPVYMPGMNSHMNGFVHSSAGTAQRFPVSRDQDETLSLLRHGFNDNTFSDCVLEVRFPDNLQYQDHPDYRRFRRALHINGHRFLLSRSPTLASLMKSWGTVPGGYMHLDINDEYMRADVFGYVLRTLYGWPLGDELTLPADISPRNIAEDFQLALSYVATAQYLQLGWVLTAAMEHVKRLLCWDTIELAVKYLLPNIATSPSSRNEPQSMSELRDLFLCFIVYNLPKDFVLDVNAGDGVFSRLPIISSPPRNSTAASGVHGTHGYGSSKGQSQSARLSSNPRLSQIKFGDISPPERNGYGQMGATKETARPHRAPTAHETILSRILLNLPYDLLKLVLEHPRFAQLLGGQDISFRYHIISGIIAERESRRLRTLDRGIPQLHVFQDKLVKAGSPLVVEQMSDFLVNNMGFKEEVFPGDVPYLLRTWINASPGSS
ncbi:hypothetical protein B0T22DRAFT_484346 [Podospora appendiculata]|uniref:BTB domain-containing protein n=1 Tax=Podospora appendiculata TaxID=314037 RepID=A0AAE0X0E8_9PEZI|nr:hypothetical protein B0T22DRAFT_484346 [Podospora appendiculata]